MPHVAVRKPCPLPPFLGVASAKSPQMDFAGWVFLVHSIQLGPASDVRIYYLPQAPTGSHRLPQLFTSEYLASISPFRMAETRARVFFP